MNGYNTLLQHRQSAGHRISRMVALGERYFLRYPLIGYATFVGVSLLLLGSVAVASLPA